jgi:hypothetical protein
MEEKVTSAARIWIDDEGIVHYQAIGTPSTAQSVIEGISAVREMAGGTPTPILFDARGWHSSDPKSWVQFINMIESVCSAAGVVVDAESQKAMGSFPSLLDTLVIPFRNFSSEDEALTFLRQHL